MSRTELRCRTIASFREEFRRGAEVTPPGSGKCCKLDQKKAKSCANSLFPSYNILKKYKWKTDLVADLVCGVTVGIMILPQAMAYAMLAEMPPVVGLYMSFFPVLIYFMLGTSRHISMGTVAVVSLLTGSVVARFYENEKGAAVAMVTNSSDPLSAGNVTVAPSEDDDENSQLALDTKLGITATLSLLVGFTQIVLGSLRLGVVTTYMSDALVAGFTTGTAIHVGTSQIKYVFGLKIPRTDGLFQVIKTYINIFQRIGDTNIPTLVTSLICMAILYTVKVHINMRFKHKLKVPIPIELLVVIAATLASHFGYFHENYHVKVVGHIPAGLPSPRVPSFIGIDKYIADIFIIAIISFAQSVSLAALMAKKHRYVIDSNQELIAYGTGNIFGSFFSCYPFAASVSRTSVQDSAGGKTQVASIFSASMVLIVILWIGPLFKPLPNCVLSAIIVVALRSMILQVLELPSVWRTSKYDFMIWVVTFLCTAILHVDYGLLIGLVFSFFTVVIRTQRTSPTLLGQIADQKVYRDPKAYVKAHSHSGVTVVGFSSPLYYANGDIFVKEVYRLSSVKPERLRKQIRRASMISENDRRTSMISTSSVVTIAPEDVEKATSLPPTLFVRSASEGNLPPYMVEKPTDFIIIDMSGIPFVDSVGCKVLKQLFTEYEAVEIKVMLTGVSDDIWAVFEATEILPKYADNLYLTIDDAIAATKNKVESPSDKLREFTGSLTISTVADEKETRTFNPHTWGVAKHEAQATEITCSGKEHLCYMTAV